MNIKDFYDLVELKKEPEASLLPYLQYRTQKHPFFQPDIFIYIKCLYLSNSEEFTTELARLVPFISDRKALFYYVMNDQYKSFQKKVEKKLSPNRTDMLINAFFESLNESGYESEYMDTIPASEMVSTDYFSYLEYVESGKEQEAEITEVQEMKSGDEDILSDDDIDTLETESGIEFVKVNEIKNTDIPELPVKSEEPPVLKHQEVIDRFIEKADSEDGVRIKLDLENQEEMSEDELDTPDPDELDINEQDEQGMENDYFFTQTLANIYIKQKKYKRAYEIIKHLNLNYPEKNIYFADQLSFLEKLIKNSNINK